MAFTAGAVGRVRPGGNDINGAWYDASTSGALATTLNGSISAGATTVVVASAAGWPASGNYYAQIGQPGAEITGGSSEIVLVTGGQGTTSWTVTRAQLGTTAIAFGTGIVVSNELTRGDTAAFAGTLGTSTASTTFTDAAGGFNETVVGLYLCLSSGTGATVGFYQIAGYTNSTTLTLDRASGTYTAGVWKIGGAAAALKRLCDSANATGNKGVAGNRVFYRGAGTEFPSSADYTQTAHIVPVGGDTTNGRFRIVGENGRPRLDGDGLIIFNAALVELDGIYWRPSSTTNISIGVLQSSGSMTVRRCVVDINDKNGPGIACGAGDVVEYNEVFSKASAPTAQSGAKGISLGGLGCSVRFNNIHHCGDRGIYMGAGGHNIAFNNVHHCESDGIQVNAVQSNVVTECNNNTIDANKGHGIDIASSGYVYNFRAKSNSISNQTGGGKNGLNVAGTLAINDRANAGIDYNNYYNNTGTYSGISAGANDTTLDPGYTDAANGDYRIGTNLKALGFPTGDYVHAPSGSRSFIDIGAMQRQEAGGASGVQARPSLTGNV